MRPAEVTAGLALVHNPARMAARRDTGWERIYAVVRRIPRGRVATYGDVAELAGMPGAARQVGWALHALAAHTRVPWQRVLNARGEVSARGEPEASRVQRALLEREGVRFAKNGRLELARYRWPSAPAGRVKKAMRGRQARRPGAARRAAQTPRTKARR